MAILKMPAGQMCTNAEISTSSTLSSNLDRHNNIHTSDERVHPSKLRPLQTLLDNLQYDLTFFNTYDLDRKQQDVVKSLRGSLALVQDHIDDRNSTGARIGIWSVINEIIKYDVDGMFQEIHDAAIKHRIAKEVGSIRGPRRDMEMRRGKRKGVGSWWFEDMECPISSRCFPLLELLEPEDE